MGLMIVPSLYAQTSQTVFNMDQLLGFGGAVEIGENEIYAGSRLMGNPRGDEPPGKVYLFQKETDSAWMSSGKLSASDGIVGDQFGYTIDMDGATLAVSAPGQNGKAGVVYVFERNEADAWEETGRLSVEASQPGDQFGYQVAVAGEFVFAAAASRNENTGTVYVFKKSEGEWTFHSELASDDPQERDGFGAALVAEGTHVVYQRTL